MSILFHQKKNKVNNPILSQIMKERGFKRSSKKWTVYLPNGYTHVEKEIFTIDLQNRNRNGNECENRSGNECENRSESIQRDKEHKVVMAVSGCDKIVSKSNLWILLNRQFGREESAKIIPESYILAYKKDLLLLKKDLKTTQNTWENVNNEKNEKDEENKNKVDTYILKKNLQRKEGLFLTKNRREILESYKKGYKLVQKYIKNPLLVKERKVNLRLYLLIISYDGKNKAFLHQYGKCIYTAKPYDDETLDFENNITSFGLDTNIYKNHPLTIDELFRYLQVFTDTELNFNQIKQLILTKIHHIMKYIMIAVDTELGKSTNLKKAYCGQLFGLDFILTNETNIWHPYLLEFNKGPDMTAKTVRDGKNKKEVIDDMFNLLGLYSKETNGFEMVYPNSIMLV